MKTLYTVASIILIVFTGCTSGTGGGTLPENGFILPMTLGNYWHHKVTLYDSLGRVEGSRIDTGIVLRDTLIGSEKWYFTGTNSSGGAFITNRSDGAYWLYPSFQTGGVEPRLQFPYPATVGVSVVHRDTIFTVTAVDSTVVVSTSTPVTTPAGTFICYRYNRYARTESSIGNFEIHSEVFMAPNKGLIKSVDYQKLASGTEVVSRQDILEKYYVQ